MKYFSASPLRLLLLLPLLALAPLAPLAQTLTNNGATLSVLPGTTLFVGGDLVSQSGGTLVNDGTVQLTGNFTLSSGATSTGAGLFRFSGTQDQSLNAPAGTVLPNVEQNNSGPVGSNRLLVPGNLIVSNLLTLSSGLVRTLPTATISLPNGATLVGEAPGRYVQGNLKITRAAVPGVVDFGHGVVLDGSGQALGAVSITRTAGLATQNVSYGTNLAASTQSIDRIWTIVPTSQPTSAMPVTFSWPVDDDNGLTNFTQARGWQQAAAGNPWLPVGASAPASVTATTRSLGRNAAVLNRFTVSNAANPLPVELSQFTAEREGSSGRLRWATASEKNSAYFAIESSTDGFAFHPLGQLAGHGISSQSHSYEWLDVNLSRYAADQVFYRLRQVDADGAESFSPIRAVQVPAATGLAFEAFPTPLRTSEGLSLRVRTAQAGPAILRATDALGRLVWSQPLEPAVGTSTFTLPEAARWPEGLYLLSLRQGTQQKVVKLVRE